MKTSHFSRMGIVCMALVVLTYFQSSGLLRAQDVGFEATKAAAEKGDPEAEYDLARCYERGTGVEKDYAKAADYLTKSAEQGYADAQVLLGSYYGKGLGVNHDPQQAVNWYRKAAEQGNALAQYAMGGFYLSGRGVAKDVNKVIKWWRKAAGSDKMVAGGCRAGPGCGHEQPGIDV